MNTATSSTQKSYAERIAWLHEPVHLRCALLPWFIVRWMELELHRFFCSIERYLLELVELNGQGKLEPWPEAEARSRVSRKYKMKLAPAAMSRSAEAALVQSSDASVMASEAEAGAVARGAPRLGDMVIGPLLAGPRKAACGRRPHRRSQADDRNAGSNAALPRDYWQNRCRKLKTFKPAAAVRENCA